MGNAGYRRRTARKGWREIDPERGRFILKPYLAIALNLAGPAIRIEFSYHSFVDLIPKGLAKVSNSALLKQQSLFDRVRKHISKLNPSDIGSF